MPVLTKIYVGIWHHHGGTHNELNLWKTHMPGPSIYLVMG